MTRLQNASILFIIIFLEGFIVLGSELVAIRLTIPFVGSGTDTISIIIAAVLMPLAFGYHAGGKFKKKRTGGSYRTIRQKLITNIIVAAAFFLPALSYFLIQFFFFSLDEMGIENNIIQVTLYCLTFIVIPVYLLGQTVPLISNYFSKERLSQVTGKMLCFSTLGSFCGSIVTTLILMEYIKVHHTVTLIFSIMALLVFILAKKNMRAQTMIILGMLGFSVMINSNQIMDSLHIVENNKYSTIMIMTLDSEDNKVPHLIINNNDSSKYSAETHEKHNYIEFAEDISIHDFPKHHAPKDILVIGAGGFTFGHNDEKNNYVYVDIDKDLKEISEKHLLKEKLKPNKTFYPMPARAYLNVTNKKFDLIFLDAYLGGLSIPEHLVTKEFFLEVDEHLKDGGVMIGNFILSPNFNNIFSKNIDNTLRSVFPYISRHDAEKDYKIWTKSKTESSNFVYIYKKHENKDNKTIFIDQADHKEK